MKFGKPEGGPHAMKRKNHDRRLTTGEFYESSDLLIAGVVASLLPALRTTRVDPVVALRDQ